MKPTITAMIALVVFVLLTTRALSQADTGLPDLGPAPDFDLVTADGQHVHLRDLRGQVVVVSFFYTWCPDVCPLHTDKKSLVRDLLGEAFGSEVAFASITFDPVRDTPDVLLDYAAAFDAHVDGWFSSPANRMRSKRWRRSTVL